MIWVFIKNGKEIDRKNCGARYHIKGKHGIEGYEEADNYQKYRAICLNDPYWVDSWTSLENAKLIGYSVLD
jgi:hypothetical protein